ncbi:3-hydroxyacyl-CoA dehydrogenase NAD-binding domain-containing protein [Paracandidimonas soli]|uniref:3-hydroxyacyl-CoA dehydrogenase/enoyl-CoA hydratase/3-hydroxybutyryl-CoA epimerase n=1 Tax=Paracandidimonas soli TaxID=1917182 RepID=A0A4R3UUY5_9BURK|nr:3-hydroxyacyl-CoA dehydrogenase NAD-binding domain-containing protein [Paracandidimonas soli]TCU93864.1 3-hydroxyacyl-CoA dehydrogenase/enoyl-CoA hydratase/3-hydroxybutyryl-CoA epimerase [Paracandidimonas soli]
MASTIDALNLRHFHCSIDTGRIAWLGIDCADSSVNRLSADVMAELGKVLDHFALKPPAGLVIHSRKSAGFIAGADISEFSSLDSAEHARSIVSRGWSMFDRLASVSYPTLALIRGHCLGGGLELALACRYRLVVDDPATSLALPEVMLGIFPGWGGMHRLPRMIGPVAALDMMLTGRPVDARKAYRIGLADGIVAPRLMERAAAQMVLSGRPRRRPGPVQSLMNHPSVRPLLAKQALKKLQQKDPQGHYPAPRAILDIWARYNGNALRTPERINSILQSDTARNLVRVFHLQERLKAFGKAGKGHAPVAHVHVVGAGVMGGDIAAWCALKGMTVTLQDQDRERIAAAQGRAYALFTRKLKDKRQARAASDRLIPDMQGHGIPHANVVIEAISENLQAKQGLYQAIEPQLRPDAILATNTSSLSLEELRTGLSRPERLVGIHFFNPVARMPLVEVVETAQTDPAAIRLAHAFVGQIGKLPLPVQSTPGFLVNAVLAPYMLEAMRCLDQGTRPETIDAAMTAFGMPMGPIELIDTVGLDIARDAGRQLTGNASMPNCLETRLSRGDLGRKTGRGFYVWKNGKPVKQQPDPIPPRLTERLIEPLVVTTRRQLDAGVVADADLADAGIIFGTGFAPFTGGPLHYMDTQNSTRHAPAAAPTAEEATS